MRYMAVMVFLVLTACSWGPDFDDADKLLREGKLDEAMAIYEPLAKAGDARAQIRLGFIYIDKRFNDTGKAAAYFQEAAKQGYGDAYSMIGLAYQYGKGLPRDINKAESALKEAVRRKSALGMYYLGTLYNDKARNEPITIIGDRIQVEEMELYRSAYEYGEPRGAMMLSHVSSLGGANVMEPQIESYAWRLALQEAILTKNSQSKFDPFVKPERMSDEDWREANSRGRAYFATFGTKKPGEGNKTLEYIPIPAPPAR